MPPETKEVWMMKKTATFETIYHRYPFAPLVELGLALAAWLKRQATKADKSNPHNTVGHAA
jgi:hypothetical protein